MFVKHYLQTWANWESCVTCDYVNHILLSLVTNPLIFIILYYIILYYPIVLSLNQTVKQCNNIYKIICFLPIMWHPVSWSYIFTSIFVDIFFHKKAMILQTDFKRIICFPGTGAPFLSEFTVIPGCISKTFAIVNNITADPQHTKLRWEAFFR